MSLDERLPDLLFSAFGRHRLQTHRNVRVCVSKRKGVCLSVEPPNPWKRREKRVLNFIEFLEIQQL